MIFRNIHIPHSGRRLLSQFNRRIIDHKNVVCRAASHTCGVWRNLVTKLWEALSNRKCFGGSGGRRGRWGLSWALSWKPNIVKMLITIIDRYRVNIALILIINIAQGCSGGRRDRWWQGSGSRERRLSVAAGERTAVCEAERGYKGSSRFCSDQFSAPWPLETEAVEMWGVLGKLFPFLPLGWGWCCSVMPVWPVTIWQAVFDGWKTEPLCINFPLLKQLREGWHGHWTEYFRHNLMRTPWRQLTTRAEESTLHSLQTGYAGHHPRCDLGTCDTGPMFLCSLFEISSALRARLVTDRWSPGHKREICWITFCLVSAPVGPCGFPCVCTLGWYWDISMWGQHGHFARLTVSRGINLES